MFEKIKYELAPFKKEIQLIIRKIFNLGKY